ncbi:MAG: sodium:solute symporter, partial [Melioribacter sp.]|nr:sodium:solute symporter [Melioribacter sp.]
VGIVAMNAIAPETLNAVVPSGWKEVFFGWHLNLDWSGIMDSVNQKIAQDGYELFTIFMMMVLFKGILVSAAGPAPNYDMQRILATKNPKEAAKMSWFVSVVLFFPRYMMIAGLTVLALVFLMPELKAMGSNIDFEMVLPLALKNLIPVGLVGVLLAGLLAAFMSTYAATLNAAPAYVVNDIYKKFINPNAPPKKYVKLSIIVSIFFAVLGFVFGILAQSVNQVTLWIVNGLWGGYTAANVLKWYWWRLNGYGYFWGMVIGIACALLMPVLFPNLPALTAFPYVLAVSVIGSILGSYLTEPEPDEVLMKFYVKVRPWGLWKPIRKKVEARFPEFKSDANFKRDIFNVVVGIIWQSTLLAAPMYLVIKEYKSFVITLIITLITSITLKFTWWNKLEEIAGEKTEKFYNEIAEKI